MPEANLPRETRESGDVAASHGVSGETGASSQRDHPASDWICVAAARNVLVVDDNDRHLDIFDAILSAVGHNVETCGSGAEALRRLDVRRFDVVVLDVVMPEVNGIVVAEHMRQTRHNAETPIIVCTANIGIANRQLADAPGVTAIIGKPIDTAGLVLAVARAPVRARQRASEQPRV